MRTYLAAAKLAAERGEPLGVRFDGEKLTTNVSGAGHQVCREWADFFLTDAVSVGRTPDVWTYLDDVNRIELDVLRPDMIEAPWNHPSVLVDRYAYLPRGPMSMIGAEAELWRAGREMPIRHYEENVAMVYAIHHRGGPWILTSTISHMILENLRGVSVIVRSHISERVSLSERVFSEALSIPMLYETVHCSVVVNDQGALSKSQLMPGGVGTYAWAVREWGKDSVTESLLRSLEDERPIIHFEEIV